MHIRYDTKHHVQSSVWRVITLTTLAALTTILCMSFPAKNDLLASENPALRPDNVVLITLDTVRADHLHCYGNQNINTPVIDALAKNGVLFEKAVTQTPLTEPSHASIFTGTNPNVHQVRNTGGFVLKPSSVTLATILQSQGRDTAAFVSATVLQKEFGFNQGFAVYDDQMPKSDDDPAASRPANLTVDHALSWLNTHSGKPFLLWLHLYDAHQPYRTPPNFSPQPPQDPYDAAIAFEDQQLGRFLDALKEKSPAGKTLIVLLSDHGEGLGQHGEVEHGVFLYDSTVRIAWIMTGPGIPSGVRIQQQARAIDVLPTLLELLGGKPSSVVQGTSMVPAFSGATVPSTYSYEETLYPKINMGWSELRGIRTNHWMYIRAPKPELYDLDSDPGELKNVIVVHPKEYRDLQAHLESLSVVETGATEKVVTSQLNQKTTEQLSSLGYIPGSEGNISLNGEGADPKDRIGVLDAFERVAGPGSEKISSADKIAILEQALKEDPTNPSLYYTLGKQYTDAGETDQAVQTYLAALRHGLENGTIFSLLGKSYLRSSRPKQAIVVFRQALKLNPSDVERQNNLANGYMQNNQQEDAEHLLQSIIARQAYAPAYNGLGFIALQRHDLSVAQKNFKYAVQLDPDYAEAQYNLGMVCLQTNDIPCAKTALNVFLAKATPAYKSFVPQVKAALLALQ